MMSLYCWKGLGSPMLSKYMTILTSFDGRSFQRHGINPSLQVQFGGNTVSIEVELVDAYIYAMKVTVSSIFHVVCFPFEDWIMTIDQMYFDNFSYSASSRFTIMVIDNFELETENVGV